MGRGAPPPAAVQPAAVQPTAVQPTPCHPSIGADGWLAGAARVESPHCDARPPQARIELLVLHCISLPRGVFGGDGIERLFTGRLDPCGDPSVDACLAPLAGLRVAAHFVIDRAGRTTQYVACGARAWHAGLSQFEGRAACNDFSIGVELEGTDDSPFDDRQYPALAALTRALVAAYPLRAVRRHSDIAPQRKTDPGPHFDWARYAAAIAPAELLLSFPPGVLP